MTNTPNEPKFQDIISLVVWLLIQILGGKKKSILQQKWPRNYFDAEDDAYELLAFVYNWEMDKLMLTNNVEDNDEEEPVPISRKWEGNEMVGPIVRKSKPHHKLHQGQTKVPMMWTQHF
jgi:uncharacterized membrane protein